MYQDRIPRNILENKPEGKRRWKDKLKPEAGQKYF